MLQTKFDNIVSKYFSLMVVLYPLLVMYSVIHIKLEYLFFIIGCILLIIKSQYSIPFFHVPKILLNFFLYMLTLPSLVFVFLINDNGSIFQTGTLFYFILLCLIIDNAKIEMIWKYYFAILNIAIIIFFLQEIMWHSIGSRFSALIPGLEFSFYENISGTEMADIQIKTNRSSSIFMEPAIFAKYLIPAFIYNLKFSKKNILNLVGLSLILLLLRSGNGLVLLLTCILILFFNLPIKRKTTKITLVILLLCISLGLGSILATTEYGAEQIARTDEFSGESNNVSGFQRVVRGYLLYDDMSITEKIIGVGTKNIRAVIDASSTKIFFDGPDDIYLNGVQAILVAGGMFGFLLFLAFLLKTWNSESIINKGFIICLSVAFLIGAEYLSSTMLLYITIASLTTGKT